MIPKLFCPLLSTDKHKVYCKEDCMWHIYNEDATGHTCAVVLNIAISGTIIEAIEKNKHKPT